MMSKIGKMGVAAVLLAATTMIPTGAMAQGRYSGKGMRKSGQTGYQKTAYQKAAYQNICNAVLKKYEDSLKVMSHKADSLLYSIDVNQRQDLLRNPYYFPLFVNPMLYRSALRQEMAIEYEFGNTLKKKPLSLLAGIADSMMAKGWQGQMGMPPMRSWAELSERERQERDFEQTKILVGADNNANPTLGTKATEAGYANAHAILDLKNDTTLEQHRKPYPRFDYSDKRLEVNKSINAFLLDLYVLHPELVKITDNELEKQKGLPRDITIEQEYRNTVSQRVEPKRPMDVVEPIVAVSRKPNFWKFSGKVSLKMMQNYNSNNWYQGAVNNSSALWKSYFTMNYNNKEKFHWDNSLEFNLGFQSDRNDKEHKYKTNTDLLRIINSVGLQASGNWYYSASLTSWTQVYPKYNNNSDYVYSDFMSPFESVLSIGMEYKKSARRWNINVKPSPLSYDFKYCDRKALYSRYGIRGNKHTQDKFGSSLTCTFNWQILPELSWRSYLYSYTNYKSSLIQWENTFSFRINKYLSTEVFLYPRFDDSYHSSKSDAKIQLREYISLGFDYSF